MSTNNFKFRNLMFFTFFILFPLLSSAQLTQQWVNRYGGTEYMNDHSSKMDGSGNLYVACSGYNSSTGYYIMVMKFTSGSSGSPVWTSTYTGISGESELATAIALDNSGNVYVTGQILGAFPLIDAITLKYNNNGVLQWSQRYNNALGGYDYGTCITVDANGNVVVGGVTNNGAGQPYDYLTIKYNSSGVMQWVRTYDGPSGTDEDDIVNSIAADAFGNVIVTGRAGWTNTGYDIVNVKYSASGVGGATRYDGGEHSDDMGYTVAFDQAGNFYVTGSTIENGVNPEITTLKFSSTNVPVWTKHYDYAYDVPHDMKLDAAGNVYVTGYSKDGSNYNFITLKYNNNGTQLWAKRLTEGDVANSLALDGNGNVYVTGYAYNSNSDIATVKYNSNGVQIGNVLTYNASTAFERGTSIVSNTSGSVVYVTGLSPTTQSSDVVVIKYSQLVGISNINSEIPENFSLEQNYPNPFNPSTTIKFAVPAEDNVSIKVYDMLGKEVAVLVNEIVKAGNYEVKFEASKLSSGTYFYRITTSSFNDVKKMMLVK
ncbi:MAG TPA: SBBP repeat-containing protein [Ignavibacteria bacterium]